MVISQRYWGRFTKQTDIPNRTSLANDRDETHDKEHAQAAAITQVFT